MGNRNIGYGVYFFQGDIIYKIWIRGILGGRGVKGNANKQYRPVTVMA